MYSGSTNGMAAAVRLANQANRPQLIDETGDQHGSEGGRGTGYPIEEAREAGIVPARYPPGVGAPGQRHGTVDVSLHTWGSAYLGSAVQPDSVTALARDLGRHNLSGKSSPIRFAPARGSGPDTRKQERHAPFASAGSNR